jgi:hypothetical protein
MNLVNDERHQESNLELMNAHAAGIDIGSGEHWVCVPPSSTEKNVQRFGCFTPDLIELADWLIECQVKTVAMEATGVYWIPLCQILEAKGLEVNLVNGYRNYIVLDYYRLLFVLKIKFVFYVVISDTERL